MIPIPPYKTRTHEQLLAGLKFAANELQMRDWQYDIYSGCEPMEEFGMKKSDLGKSLVYVQNLMCRIYIHIGRCAEYNNDPLDVLFHEIWHAYLDYNECKAEGNPLERMCNLGAIFLMTRYTTKKGKK